jgi:hypothetical protein
MFPNVRLMIAATLASVVALICGFGMFAVFRVSHEPFVRLPAATAPLLLVADNSVSLPAGFAAGVPLDRRLQVEPRPGTAEAVNAPAAADEHSAPAETTAPATAPAADTAAPDPEETFATIDEPAEPPTASASPPSEAPAATTDSAPSGDPANVTATAGPDAAPSATNGDIGTAAPSPGTTTSAAEQDVTSPVVAMPGAEPASGAAMDAAASDAQKETQPASEPANLAAAPVDVADPADEGPHKTEAKKPKRSHVARTRRAPRVAAAQYSESQISPYAPASEQNFGASQMNFQTIQTSQGQYFAARPVRVRHTRTAAKKTKELNKEPNKEPNTATGGPFVSATSR